jgi:hypothetical protein
MNTTTTTSSNGKGTRPVPPPSAEVHERENDLRSLATMDVEELGQLYAAGTVPPSLDVLEGHPRGRMLAIRALDHGSRGSALRRFSGWGAFPWEGKSFSGTGATGTGINRIKLVGRKNWFPFRTSIRDSVIDGAPCIVLDYDLKENPAFIRAIHDELRQIEPQLFLGPAMLKARKGPTFVLWFALDTSQQSPPI